LLNGFYLQIRKKKISSTETNLSSAQPTEKICPGRSSLRAAKQREPEQQMPSDVYL
jgi:hypothetical protein